MGNNKQLNKVEEINSRAETGDVKTSVVEFLEAEAVKMTGQIFIIAHKHHDVLRKKRGRSFEEFCQ